MFTENDAQCILAPYHAKLFRIVSTAWECWLNRKGEYVEPYKRTARVDMHQFMVQEAKREFCDVQGVHIVEKHETILISFGNEVAVCLKKLDEFLRTSNIPTPRQQDFFAQLSLPDCPDCKRLVVGYVPDPLGFQIETHVVYYERGELVWSYPLNDSRACVLPTTEAPSSEESGWTFTPKTNEDSSKEQQVS